MPKRRVLVLVLAAFSLTCAAQRGKPSGAIANESASAPAASPMSDDVEGELQRPDGVLASGRAAGGDEGGHRDPTIVMEESTFATDSLRSLPKPASAPAGSPAPAVPPRMSPASPVDGAAPRKKAALDPLSGGARISKTMAKESHKSVVVSDVETTEAAPSAPAMKAGRHDDNKEYNRFLVSKLVIKGGEAELFAKLVRVSTGEVLSVASVRVTGGAGGGS